MNMEDRVIEAIRTFSKDFKMIITNKEILILKSVFTVQRRVNREAFGKYLLLTGQNNGHIIAVFSKYIVFVSINGEEIKPFK